MNDERPLAERPDDDGVDGDGTDELDGRESVPDAEQPRRRGFLFTLGWVVLAVIVGALALSLTSRGTDQPATAEDPKEVPRPTPRRLRPMINQDKDVTFTSGPLTLHGSLRLPAGPGPKVPAALLIAGSGPTDRNGNSAVPGLGEVKLDELKWLADQLSAQGYASLRYDKLGSGATGLGPYQPTDLANMTFQETFLRNAQDALAYLAAQPGVDPRNLLVVGHSEGGMIALAVHADPGDAPRPARLALVEPQYAPILEIVASQVSGQVASAATAGLVTAEQADDLTGWIDKVVEQLRAGTPVGEITAPPYPDATGVVEQFQTAVTSILLNPNNAQLLRTEDTLDPVALAKKVNGDQSVLVTCGTKDVNTPCEEVGALARAFPGGVATLVTLPDTVHELRDIGDADPATVPITDYPKYPFSAVLGDEFRNFLG